MEPQNPETETPEDAPAPPSRWSGLGTRTLSSAVLGGAFLLAAWQGGWVFTWLIILAALMMAREWNAMTEEQPVGWRVGGLFYVTIPCASLIWLRDVHTPDAPDAGLWLTFFVLFCVWATDIGAYFTGRQIGGPKIAPEISPGKTWAGLAGGVAAAAVTGGILSGFAPNPSLFFTCALIGALLAVLAQVGDFFESWVKRRVGVKDSSTLIPGHGGLLDRVDGLTLTVPAFAVAVSRCVAI